MLKSRIRILLIAALPVALFAPYPFSADAGSSPSPLAETTPGNPEKGKKLFINRKKGNCLACHALEKLADEPFHGQVGPPLDALADRMSEGEIRFQIIDAQASNPDSIMPAYFRIEGLNRVLKKWRGKPILSAQEVEDMVAYLQTLKSD